MTPGYEAWLLQYLSSDPVLPDWQADLLDDFVADDPNQRIAPLVSDLAGITQQDVHNREFEELWLELIADNHPGVLRGVGRLRVNPGQSQVQLVATQERVSAVDVGREIYISASRYEIASVELASGESEGVFFTLDRTFEGPNGGDVVFATGAVRRGPPWEVTVPTTLVILSSTRADLA